MEPWRHVELLLPDLVCVAVCLVATVTDLRSRRIPNWLTLPAAAGGLLINTLLPSLTVGIETGLKVGLLTAAAGGLLLLLAFGALGALSLVGMGDVKLMIAVGTLLRWPTALWALVYVTLAGGVFAVLYALVKGRLGAVLRNLLSLSGSVLRRRKRPDDVELHRVPYALAILAGAAWAAAVKYFPTLALP